MNKAIQIFIMKNQNNFTPEQMSVIQNEFEKMSEEDVQMLTTTGSQFKNPTLMLVISLFLGYLGVDRFLLGEIGMGVLKLLTFGCLGVLTIIDWITVMGKTREKNMEIIIQAIQMQKNMNKSMPNSSNGDNFETLKKYKELLENGMITQEEFNRKKAELI